MEDLEIKKAAISKFTLAVDLGSSEIVAMLGVASPNGESVQVVAMEKEASNGSISCGKVKNIETAAGILKGVLRKLHNRASNCLKQIGMLSDGYKLCFNKLNVLINVGGLQGVSKVIERNLGHEEITKELLESMNGENVRSAQSKYPRNSNHCFYKSFPQRFVVDGIEEENPVGLVCDHFEVEYQNILVPGDYFDNLEACLARAGFDKGAYEFVFSAEALAATTLTLQERMEGVVLVDMGGEVTSISVWNNNSLKYVYELSKGADKITSDLMELKISKEIALNLKFQGCAYAQASRNEMVSYEIYGALREFNMRTINGIIESRVNSLMSTIAKVKNSVRVGASANSAVIVGGATNMTGMKEKMEEYLGVMVRRGSVGKVKTNAMLRSCAAALSAIYVGTGNCVSLEKIILEAKPVEKKKKNILGSLLEHLPFGEGIPFFVDPSEKPSDNLK